MPDVIIKGMEMPENCNECLICCEHSMLYKAITDRRSPDCPLSPAPEWISVEERLPEAAGNYIVAYHPCYWDDVKYQVTNVGIDAFRGKTTWAKNKHQRVTHWMPLPEPPEVK